jgi:hypothetical protein
MNRSRIRMMPKEKPLFKIKIEVPGSKRGHISVPLLLKICQDAQKAVTGQANAIEGRKQSAGESKAGELTLELVRLGKGSTVLDFMQSQSGQMPMSFMEDLPPISVEAVNHIADTLNAANRRGKGWQEKAVPEVLDALDDLGDTFKEGVTYFKWIVPARNGNSRGRKMAKFAPNTLSKIKHRRQELALAKRAIGTAEQNPSETHEAFLEGMLEVADGKCRIDPVVGTPLIVTFGADQASMVLEAIHRPVRASFDQQSRRLVDISLRDNNMDKELFFDAKDINALIAEQGAGVISDLEVLSGAIPDEDLDEFVGEIYAERYASSE